MSDEAISLTIALRKPATFDGREYAQLVLFEPSVKTVLRGDEQLRQGVTASALRNRQIHIVALSANVPVPVVEQLPITELSRAWAFLAPFLDDGQATGAL